LLATLTYPNPSSIPFPSPLLLIITILSMP
jgi:hypothetical protein